MGVNAGGFANAFPSAVMAVCRAGSGLRRRAAGAGVVATAVLALACAAATVTAVAAGASGDAGGHPGLAQRGGLYVGARTMEPSPLAVAIAWQGRARCAGGRPAGGAAATAGGWVGRGWRA